MDPKAAGKMKMTLKRDESLAWGEDKRMIPFAWRLFYAVKDGLTDLEDPIWGLEKDFGSEYIKPDCYKVTDVVSFLYDAAIEIGVSHETMEYCIAYHIDEIKRRTSMEIGDLYREAYLPDIRKLSLLEERFEIVERDIEEVLESKLGGE